MKRLFALGAVSMMLVGSAFAACPLKTHETWAPLPNCEKITYYEYAMPAQPCCEPIVEPDPCCCEPVKDPCGCTNRSFMGKIFDGTKGVYDATLGNVFGFLSGR